MLVFEKKINMPGRLVLFDDKTFKKDCSALINNDMIKEISPSYNIAPTHALAVLLNNGNYLYAHFGFLPVWAKDRTSMNINARSESVFEKTSFREAFKTRRCLIPINGVYEWQKEEKEKIPFYVSSCESSYMAMAGIWEEWYDKELKMKIVSLAILTCDANDKLKRIHHRMPIIIEKEFFSTWLHSSDVSVLNSLFNIYESEKIQMQEVSKEMNKVTFNTSTCIQTVIKKDENKEKKERKNLSLFDL